MTLHEVELDELGLWKPRSGFFQHEYRKKRSRLMVQQAPAEHGARLAFCTYCQSAYLASDAVPNSACHDSPPALMYDLERLIDAATFVETFSEALQATDPEDLLHRIEILAELVRVKVAGAADQLSQEPSNASAPATADDAAERDNTSLKPAFEGSQDAPADPPPPPPTDDAAVIKPQPRAKAAASSPPKRTRRQPAAATA